MIHSESGPRHTWTVRRLLQGQVLQILAIAALRACAGLLDLVLAGALYVLLLLLQGIRPDAHWRWAAHDVLAAALVAAAVIPIRGGMEIVSLQAALHYLGNVQKRSCAALAKGYSEMRWDRFVQKNRSDLTNLVTNTAKEATSFLNLAIELLASIVVIGAMLTAMILRSPQAAGMIAAVLAIGYWANRYFIRQKLRVAGAEKEVASRELQRAFSDLFLFGKEIRAYSAHNWIYERIERRLDVVKKKTLQLMLLPQITKSSVDLGVTLAFVTAVLVVQWHGGDMHRMLSLLVYYLVLSRRLLPLLSQVSFMLGELEGSYASACLLQDELKECERYRAELIPSAAPAPGLVLEIDGLRFAHEGSTVLQHVTLQQHAGEVLLLRGASGSGKTSLLNLITGIAAPLAGFVRVDRNNVAYVPQEIILLDGTVRDNLLFGGPLRDDETLLRALSLAELEEFVRAMPMGLDTSVGDNGIRFSGGERQRLGLARAIARDARLLLLDEATSALDEATERRVFANLRRSGLALLAVTHRRGNGVAGDRELFLFEGQIVEDAPKHTDAKKATLEESVA